MASISVITVCRNASRHIVGCLESVASQRHPEVEHLVIDGASTDGTADRVRETANPLVRLVSEPDGGLYDAMNKGLALAGGDIVGFLHADDFFAHADVLARVDAALAVAAVDACYGDLEYVAADDPGRVVRHWKAGDFHPGDFGSGWMPPHPTFYARAGVYRRHGGFDTRFRIGADWDLLLRFFEVGGIRARYLPEVMVRMRTGGISNRTWWNVFRNNLECLAAFRKYGLRIPWTFPLAKLRHRLAQLR